MTKRRTYTNKQREEALHLYKTEGTSAASKKTGIPKSTLQSWAKTAGVRTVRNEKVRARVEAAQLDNAERRARIIADLYDLADGTVDLLKSPDTYRTLQKTKGGAERVAKPGFIPSQDKQREVTAAAIMLDKAATLEKFDSDNGATNAKGLLVALAEQIGVGSE